MAIERAYAAVDANSVNGAQTVLSGFNIAGVNRYAAGSWAVHLTDDLVSVQCAVKVSVNAGDATHRFHGYNRVSRRQIDVFIMDNNGDGADADFTIDVYADNDASIGA